ncbi:hypothetical protein C8R43DRAFT_942610 [Mycena crocata]|nr:hypothetical protein C8R43DRAFT_942610 [Mycena crocata]
MNPVWGRRRSMISRRSLLSAYSEGTARPRPRTRSERHFSASMPPSSSSSNSHSHSGHGHAGALFFASLSFMTPSNSNARPPGSARLSGWFAHLSGSTDPAFNIHNLGQPQPRREHRGGVGGGGGGGSDGEKEKEKGSSGSSGAKTSLLDKAVRYLLDGDAARDRSPEEIRLMGVRLPVWGRADEERVAAGQLHSSSSHGHGHSTLHHSTHAHSAHRHKRSPSAYKCMSTSTHPRAESSFYTSSDTAPPVPSTRSEFGAAVGMRAVGAFVSSANLSSTAAHRIQQYRTGTGTGTEPTTRPRRAMRLRARRIAEVGVGDMRQIRTRASSFHASYASNASSTTKEKWWALGTGGTKGWTLDTGWGCMLRTGQSLLATALQRVGATSADRHCVHARYTPEGESHCVELERSGGLSCRGRVTGIVWKSPPSMYFAPSREWVVGSAASGGMRADGAERATPGPMLRGPRPSVNTTMECSPTALHTRFWCWWGFGSAGGSQVGWGIEIDGEIFYFDLISSTVLCEPIPRLIWTLCMCSPCMDAAARRICVVTKRRSKWLQLILFKYAVQPSSALLIKHRSAGPSVLQLGIHPYKYSRQCTPSPFKTLRAILAKKRRVFARRAFAFGKRPPFHTGGPGPEGWIDAILDL